MLEENSTLQQQIQQQQPPCDEVPDHFLCPI